ncbi:MAG: hypothetical protein AAF682_29760 [Planctomycetota bacterium]
MSRLAALAVLALLALVAPLAAQDKKARNDPTSCPYCGNDPGVMMRAGLVGHGPFEFGAPDNDTASVGGFLIADVYWLESEHFEIGLALAPYKVPQKEKNKIRAELTELAEVLPNVDPKAKVLDEWLRLHLFAQRSEKVWDRFLEIMQKDEDFFPAEGSRWVLGTPYAGEGPYVGQRGKYEVLLLTSEAEHVAFLKEQFGLSIRRTQRWNVTDPARDTITVTIHLDQGSLKKDTALHGHLAFNLAHNLLDGYKHYSYDTPLWIHEGLAHFMEREVTTRYNTFDSTEGALAEETRKSKWIPEVKKLLSAGDAPRLAELMGLQSYAAFELRHHFATWSMIDFLIQAHPDGFACLNDKLHGRKTPEGYADSANLRDAHRQAFKECLGMSYAQFDQAWKEWVGAQVGRKD